MKLNGKITSWKEDLSVIAARARKIAGSTWKALSFNIMEGVVIPKKCLAVTIGKGSVSVAYGMRLLSKPRVKGLKRYSFNETGYVHPDNLASAIELAVDEFRAGSVEIVLGVPREWVMIRQAELPIVVKENITSAVSYELDRLTPFNQSEALYDFTVCGEENGKLNVLLAAMRVDTLRPYLHALREKGIVPSRVTPAVTGLGTLCSVMGDKDESAVCVSIGDNGYEGCVVKKGAFIASFCGNFPSGDHEKNLGIVKEELVPLLEQLSREGVTPAVYLSAVPGYTGLEHVICTPVRVLNRDIVKKVLNIDSEDALTEPLGLLMETIRRGMQRLDLASKGMRETRRAPMAVTAVLLALIAATLAVYVIAPVEMEKRRLQAIEYQIKIRRADLRKVEALKKEIDAVNAEIARISEFKESRPMTLHVLRELTKVLPKSVWLVRSRITDEKVEIEGYAASATETLPKLEQSDLFKKAEFSSPTTRDTRQNAERFSVRMEIEGYEKQEKIEHAKNEKKK